eukprot:TRINITY_DN115017_c0_g1_i1.p1 TRINITY_DN115017_c0_g1~~TRINITY_DN115017_c0_g1_i1.p1  ORF type:complete len:275 (-),score=57.45 TRINITY_DN115017_c0_g1_i1:3-827(-)
MAPTCSSVRSSVLGLVFMNDGFGLREQIFSCLCMEMHKRSVVAASLHSQVNRRLAALQKLASFRQKGSSELSEALYARLADSSHEVRFEAALILISPADKITGDEAAVPLLLSCVHDDSSCVREAAINALGRIVGVGDSAVMAALMRRFEDTSFRVREAAVLVVSKLLPLKSDDAVKLLEEELNSASPLARVAGLQALALTVPRGAPAGLAAALAHLKDPCCAVREASVHCLSRLADRHSSRALTALLECVGNDSEAWEIRKAAVSAYDIASME